MSGLFTPELDEDDTKPDTGETERCTPERLLAFYRELGRKPTLGECKKRFGGILGPMVDGWELQRRGLLPK